MFKCGDMAVYPAHGVGQIESIENKTIGDANQSFYVMKIIETGMVVMIPTTGKSTGLRNIIPSKEVEKVYDILRQKDIVIKAQPWNQRYRDYMQKIKTGSVYEIASVLRDLNVLSSDKSLSFGERKMMDTAKSLLVKEIAIANETKEDKVEKDLENIFS
ncbi:MAG: CarD family transcriptional regulator [Proteobacteria bacterium]|nr:CarD family transcriptional regulator [Pseudomonadota bacterium]MBU1739242.1 CarD family transcriptional regulator [Pseudomonadota bacterium]